MNDYLIEYTNVSDYVPRLPEAKETAHLQHLLYALDEYAREFQAAIALFELAKRDLADLKILFPTDSAFVSRMRTSWQFMAARDGAMTIYHFGNTLYGIRSSGSRECTTIRSQVDHQQLKNAVGVFHGYFPNFEDLRHSIAHAGEHRASPQYVELNQTVSGGFVNLSLFNDYFVVTSKRKVSAYQIGRDSLQKLIKVRDLVFSVFLPLDTKMAIPYVRQYLLNLPGWSSIPF